MLKGLILYNILNLFLKYIGLYLNLGVKNESLQLNVFTVFNRNYSKMKFLLLILILFL